VNFHRQQHPHFTDLKSAHPQIGILPQAGCMWYWLGDKGVSFIVAYIRKRVRINHAPAATATLAAPASVWTCTGHTGRIGRILYTWPYYRVNVISRPYARKLNFAIFCPYRRKFKRIYIRYFPSVRTEIKCYNSLFSIRTDGNLQLNFAIFRP